MRHKYTDYNALAMLDSHNTRNDNNDKTFIGRHPLIANIFIIIIVAVLGLVITYLSLSLFTKHGQTDKVPGVINMSYTNAVERLHDEGFKCVIRDSVYLENVKPGYVVEQFPKAGAIVKPGRKIFLYINAVHPKEVIIDAAGGNSREYALRGLSMRQAKAQLEELGFRNIRIVYILGDTDRVVKVLANGHPVMKMDRVAVNSRIVLEVYDGRKQALTDSLYNSEYRRDRGNYDYSEQSEDNFDDVSGYNSEESEEQYADPDFVIDF